jgi:hypothetical protein
VKSHRNILYLLVICFKSEILKNISIRIIPAALRHDRKKAMPEHCDVHLMEYSIVYREMETYIVGEMETE